jgi:hemerythrin-like domain-containing protein
MLATQILMDEHKLIKRVLIALEAAALQVSSVELMRPAFFLNAALFIRNFADGSHHHKEEGILFIAMQEAGMPVQGGPIGVMLAEHEQGREFTREMNAAAEKWEKGDRSAKAAVAHNALGYVSLLRQHIHKEDNILFPMADRVLSQEGREKLEAAFKQAIDQETEAGIQEKYLALAEVLEKESQSYQ